MHWYAKCEKEYKSTEHIFHQYLRAAMSDEQSAEWQKFGTIGQF